MTHRQRGPVSNAAVDQPLEASAGRFQAEIAGLRRSRRHLVGAALADRRALERALHDGLQQQLVAVAIDLRRLAGLLDGQPAPAKVLLDEIAANLRDALAEAGALAQLIHPPLLEGRGLAASIRSAAEKAGVTVMVDAPSGADYPPEVITVVYWTCAELLSSASPGSEATVSIRDEDGGLAFEAAITGSHSATGIERLRDRIEALDGRFSAATDGQGSRVHGWLPSSR